MTAELSLTQKSSFPPTASLDGGAGINSPRSIRQTPWVKIVRGEPESVSADEPEVIAITDSAPALTVSDSGSGQSLGKTLVADGDSREVVESSNGGNAGDVAVKIDSQEVVESSDGGNAGDVAVKIVWNKPLNVPAAADSSPVVMGAEAWPDLSEAAVARLPKLAIESPSKPVPVVPVTLPQVPVNSHTQHKHAKPNANSNNNNNHGHFNRQNSTKQRSSGPGRGGSTGFTRPPPPPITPPLPPPFPMLDMPNAYTPVGGEGPHHRPNGNWTPRPNGDHFQHRNSSPRGTFVGGRPRGDGHYVNGYRGRRDQDRDWHGPRGSNGRDAHMPHQMVPPPHTPRGFIRPPHPGAPPFIPHQPLRPFVNPMGYDMPLPYHYVPAIPPPEALRGAPVMPHAAPMFFPPPLPTLILNQIEYYFSDINLATDAYLKSNMDNEAWVPVTLIANFRRVKSLTNDIQLILNSLMNSSVVEIQGSRLRPRNWERWITRSRESSSQSLQNLIVDNVTSSVQDPSSSSDKNAH